MMVEERPYTFDRVARFFVSAGVLALVVLFLWYFSDVLWPFAVALLGAYLLNPLVGKLQKLVKNRVVAVLLLMLLVLVVIGVVLFVFLPMMAGEIVSTAQSIYQFVNNADISAKLSSYLPNHLWVAIRQFTQSDQFQQFFSSGDQGSLAQTAASKVLPWIWNFISGTASLIWGLVGLSVIVLYLAFLLLDFEKVRGRWDEFVPQQYRETIRDFVGDFNLYMGRYFRAQAVVASIVGVLSAVGFLIIGLPMAIAMGLFVGLLNMVPYLQLLSVPIALILSVVHAMDAGSSVVLAMGLTLLVFAVVQVIQDGLLTPKIMGDVTGLSPAIILLSLALWGKVLGLLGLLIAIPATCLGLAWYERMLNQPANAPDDGTQNPS